MRVRFRIRVRVRAKVRVRTIHFSWQKIRKRTSSQTVAAHLKSTRLESFMGQTGNGKKRHVHEG